MSINSIIHRKIDKSKVNIEAYLLGNAVQKRQSSQPPIGTVVRTTSQVPPAPTNPSNTLLKTSTAKPFKNELEGKTLILNGDKIESANGFLMKIGKDDNKFEISYEKDRVKYKIQSQKDQIIPQKTKINIPQNTIVFPLKVFSFKKIDDKGGQNAKTLANQQLTLYIKDYEQIRHFVENSFSDGLLQPGFNLEQRPAQGANGQGTLHPEQQEDDQSATINFKQITNQQLMETQKLRRTIKDMKEEDKMTVLFEIFKIKKQFEDPNSIKKLKCPIFTCGKTYREVAQLKNHLKTKHPELSKHGIELTEYDGTFEYSNKALDLALFLGKIFPYQLKKIVKKMKAKPIE